MISHTPGPWLAKPWIEYGPGDDFTLWRDAYVDATGATVYQPLARMTPHSTLNKAEREANAMLVAAAPELLDALKDATRMIEDSFRLALGMASKREKDKECAEHVPLAKFRAAIAKAEGK